MMVVPGRLELDTEVVNDSSSSVAVYSGAGSTLENISAWNWTKARETHEARAAIVFRRSRLMMK